VRAPARQAADCKSRTRPGAESRTMAARPVGQQFVSVDDYDVMVYPGFLRRTVRTPAAVHCARACTQGSICVPAACVFALCVPAAVGRFASFAARAGQPRPPRRRSGKWAGAKLLPWAVTRVASRY
jgi:hypothetical protein